MSVPTSVVRLQAEQHELIVPTVKKTVGIPEKGIGDAAGKANLESQLESPVPGRHSLYVATSDAWGNGPLLGNLYKNRLFNPKRQKMEIVVP